MTEETRGRERFSHHPIEHAEVHGDMTVRELADAYGRAGIGAADVHHAVELTARMFEDDVRLFVSLAGAMVPGGMRRIVSDLIRDGYVDALVTTGANLTHDTIDAIGGAHHHGETTPRGPDEREHDEALREEGVDRIYNVYLPQEHFTALERHLRSEVFPAIDERVSIQALTHELGAANARVNAEQSIDADPGIAAAAYEAEVPIYCPAIQDSILGLQAWMFGQVNDFSLDALWDMSHLNDRAYEATPAGALLIGGGVPKNFVLQARLVTPDPYQYAVQLTMDPPASGGLSGATLNEARSWGKIAPDGQNASVYGDATITLPLVVAAARGRVEST